MNIKNNIAMAQEYVEERAMIVLYTGEFTNERTRYGESVILRNIVCPALETISAKQDIKISFNTKSITIHVLRFDAWSLEHTINEKQCRDWAIIKGHMDEYTPVLDETQSNRFIRRWEDMQRELGRTVASSGDVAVTVSATTQKAVNVQGERVAVCKGIATPKRERVKQKYPKHAPVVGKQPAIAAQVAAVIADVMEPEPALPVPKKEKVNPHRALMEAMVQDSLTKDGVPFATYKLKQNDATVYEFENVFIQFNKTTVLVEAVTEFDQTENDTALKFLRSPWLAGKYNAGAIPVLEEILSVCKELARLRNMPVFQQKEIVFLHSGSNFITDRKGNPAFMTRVLQIYVYYRIEGLNCNRVDMSQSMSLRYTKDMLFGIGRTDGPHTEKKLTAELTAPIKHIDNRRYYRPYGNAPFKLMFLECEEVTFTTNEGLLKAFGIYVPKESRERDWHIVRVSNEIAANNPYKVKAQ